MSDEPNGYSKSRMGEQISHTGSEGSSISGILPPLKLPPLSLPPLKATEQYSTLCSPRVSSFSSPGHGEMSNSNYPSSSKSNSNGSSMVGMLPSISLIHDTHKGREKTPQYIQSELNDTDAYVTSKMISSANYHDMMPYNNYMYQQESSSQFPAQSPHGAQSSSYGYSTDSPSLLFQSYKQYSNPITSASNYVSVQDEIERVMNSSSIVSRNTESSSSNSTQSSSSAMPTFQVSSSINNTKPKPTSRSALIPPPLPVRTMKKPDIKIIQKETVILGDDRKGNAKADPVAAQKVDPRISVSKEPQQEREEEVKQRRPHLVPKRYQHPGDDSNPSDLSVSLSGARKGKKVNENSEQVQENTAKRSRSRKPKVKESSIPPVPITSPSIITNTVAPARPSSSHIGYAQLLNMEFRKPNPRNKRQKVEVVYKVDPAVAEVLASLEGHRRAISENREAEGSVPIMPAAAPTPETWPDAPEESSDSSETVSNFNPTDEIESEVVGVLKANRIPSKTADKVVTTTPITSAEMIYQEASSNSSLANVHQSSREIIQSPRIQEIAESRKKNLNPYIDPTLQDKLAEKMGQVGMSFSGSPSTTQGHQRELFENVPTPRAHGRNFEANRKSYLNDCPPARYQNFGTERNRGEFVENRVREVNEGQEMIRKKMANTFGTSVADNEVIDKQLYSTVNPSNSEVSREMSHVNKEKARLMLKMQYKQEKWAIRKLILEDDCLQQEMANLKNTLMTINESNSETMNELLGSVQNLISDDSSSDELSLESSSISISDRDISEDEQDSEEEISVRTEVSERQFSEVLETPTMNRAMSMKQQRVQQDSIPISRATQNFDNRESVITGSSSHCNRIENNPMRDHFTPSNADILPTNKYSSDARRDFERTPRSSDLSRTDQQRGSYSTSPSFSQEPSSNSVSRELLSTNKSLLLTTAVGENSPTVENEQSGRKRKSTARVRKPAPFIDFGTEDPQQIVQQIKETHRAKELKALKLAEELRLQQNREREANERKKQASKVIDSQIVRNRPANFPVTVSIADVPVTMQLAISVSSSTTPSGSNQILLNTNQNTPIVVTCTTQPFPVLQYVNRPTPAETIVAKAGNVTIPVEKIQIGNSGDSGMFIMAENLDNIVRGPDSSSRQIEPQQRLDVQIPPAQYKTSSNISQPPLQSSKYAGQPQQPGRNVMSNNHQPQVQSPQIRSSNLARQPQQSVQSTQIGKAQSAHPNAKQPLNLRQPQVLQSTGTSSDSIRSQKAGHVEQPRLYQLTEISSTQRICSQVLQSPMPTCNSGSQPHSLQNPNKFNSTNPVAPQKTINSTSPKVDARQTGRSSSLGSQARISPQTLNSTNPPIQQQHNHHQSIGNLSVHGRQSNTQPPLYASSSNVQRHASGAFSKSQGSNSLANNVRELQISGSITNFSNHMKEEHNRQGTSTSSSYDKESQELPSSMKHKVHKKQESALNQMSSNPKSESAQKDPRFEKSSTNNVGLQKFPPKIAETSQPIVLDYTEDFDDYEDEDFDEFDGMETPYSFTDKPPQFETKKSFEVGNRPLAKNVHPTTGLSNAAATSNIESLQDETPDDSLQGYALEHSGSGTTFGSNSEEVRANSIGKQISVNHEVATAIRSLSVPSNTMNTKKSTENDVSGKDSIIGEKTAEDLGRSIEIDKKQSVSNTKESLLKDVSKSKPPLARFDSIENFDDIDGTQDEMGLGPRLSEIFDEDRGNLDIFPDSVIGVVDRELMWDPTESGLSRFEADDSLWDERNNTNIENPSSIGRDDDSQFITTNFGSSLEVFASPSKGVDPLSPFPDNEGLRSDHPWLLPSTSNNPDSMLRNESIYDKQRSYAVSDDALKFPENESDLLESPVQTQKSPKSTQNDIWKGDDTIPKLSSNIPDESSNLAGKESLGISHPTTSPTRSKALDNSSKACLPTPETDIEVLYQKTVNDRAQIPKNFISQIVPTSMTVTENPEQKMQLIGAQSESSEVSSLGKKPRKERKSRVSKASKSSERPTEAVGLLSARIVQQNGKELVPSLPLVSPQSINIKETLSDEALHQKSSPVISMPRTEEFSKKRMEDVRAPAAPLPPRSNESVFLINGGKSSLEALANLVKAAGSEVPPISVNFSPSSLNMSPLTFPISSVNFGNSGMKNTTFSKQSPSKSKKLTEQMKTLTSPRTPTKTGELSIGAANENFREPPKNLSNTSPAGKSQLRFSLDAIMCNNTHSGISPAVPTKSVSLPILPVSKILEKLMSSSDKIKKKSGFLSQPASPSEVSKTVPTQVSTPRRSSTGTSRLSLIADKLSAKAMKAAEDDASQNFNDVSLLSATESMEGLVGEKRTEPKSTPRKRNNKSTDEKSLQDLIATIEKLPQLQVSFSENLEKYQPQQCDFTTSKNCLSSLDVQTTKSMETDQHFECRQKITLLQSSSPSTSISKEVPSFPHRSESPVNSFLEPCSSLKSQEFESNNKIPMIEKPALVEVTVNDCNEEITKEAITTEAPPLSQLASGNEAETPVSISMETSTNEQYDRSSDDFVDLNDRETELIPSPPVENIIPAKTKTDLISDSNNVDITVPPMTEQQLEQTLSDEKVCNLPTENEDLVVEKDEKSLEASTPITECSSDFSTEKSSVHPIEVQGEVDGQHPGVNSLIDDRIENSNQQQESEQSSTSSGLDQQNAQASTAQDRQNAQPVIAETLLASPSGENADPVVSLHAPVIVEDTVMIHSPPKVESLSAEMPSETNPVSESPTRMDPREDVDSHTETSSELLPKCESTNTPSDLLLTSDSTLPTLKSSPTCGSVEYSPEPSLPSTDTTSSKSVKTDGSTEINENIVIVHPVQIEAADSVSSEPVSKSPVPPSSDRNSFEPESTSISASPSQKSPIPTAESTLPCQMSEKSPERPDETSTIGPSELQIEEPIIEKPKRRRKHIGRPKGSKNKPRDPSIEVKEVKKKVKLNIEKPTRKSERIVVPSESSSIPDSTQSTSSKVDELVTINSSRESTPSETTPTPSVQTSPVPVFDTRLASSIEELIGMFVPMELQQSMNTEFSVDAESSFSQTQRTETDVSPLPRRVGRMKGSKNKRVGQPKGWRTKRTVQTSEESTVTIDEDAFPTPEDQPTSETLLAQNINHFPTPPRTASNPNAEADRSIGEQSNIQNVDHEAPSSVSLESPNEGRRARKIKKRRPRLNAPYRKKGRYAQARLLAIQQSAELETPNETDQESTLKLAKRMRLAREIKRRKRASMIESSTKPSVEGIDRTSGSDETIPTESGPNPSHDQEQDQPSTSLVQENSVVPENDSAAALKEIPSGRPKRTQNKLNYKLTGTRRKREKSFIDGAASSSEVQSQSQVSSNVSLDASEVPRRKKIGVRRKRTIDAVEDLSTEHKVNEVVDQEPASFNEIQSSSLKELPESSKSLERSEHNEAQAEAWAEDGIPIKKKTGRPLGSKNKLPRKKKQPPVIDLSLAPLAVEGSNQQAVQEENQIRLDAPLSLLPLETPAEISSDCSQLSPRLEQSSKMESTTAPVSSTSFAIISSVSQEKESEVTILNDLSRPSASNEDQIESSAELSKAPQTLEPIQDVAALETSTNRKIKRSTGVRRKRKNSLESLPTFGTKLEVDKGAEERNLAISGNSEQPPQVESSEIPTKKKGRPYGSRNKPRAVDEPHVEKKVFKPRKRKNEGLGVSVDLSKSTSQIDNLMAEASQLPVESSLMASSTFTGKSTDSTTFPDNVASSTMEHSNEVESSNMSLLTTEIINPTVPEEKIKEEEKPIDAPSSSNFTELGQYSEEGSSSPDRVADRKEGGPSEEPEERQPPMPFEVFFDPVTNDLSPVQSQRRKKRRRRVILNPAPRKYYASQRAARLAKEAHGHEEDGEEPGQDQEENEGSDEFEI